MTTYLRLPPPGTRFMKDGAATFAALPTGNTVGEMRIAQDTGTLYYWTGAAWSAIGAGIGTITTEDLTAITDGSAATAGKIGELITGTQAANTTTGVAASGSWGDVTSAALTAGVWVAQGTVGFNENSAVLTDTIECGISASATGAGISEFDTTVQIGMVSGSNDTIMSTPLVHINIAAGATYYLNTKFNYTSGTPQHRGRLIARRIR